MPTVIFDFDSTLISCESLEVILEEKIQDQPEQINKIHEITELGMSGKCAFGESLAKRLAIAQPTLQDVNNFALKASQFLTPGLKGLIEDLQKASVAVWIVSGALRETLIPLGLELGIPLEQICGVQLKWHPNGTFDRLDKEDPFSRSKAEGVRHLSKKWTTPSVGVGDGMTDYALFAQNHVKHFIAYTEHVRRPILLDQGVSEAQNVNELRQLLGRLLNAYTILS